MNQSPLSAARALHTAAVATLTACALLGPQRAAAQEGEMMPEELIPQAARDEHTVRVSPHLVVFDERTRSATVEFANRGKTPAHAVVAVEYGFPYWPDHNTAPPTHQNFPNSRDTVIKAPGPSDRFVGRWLSGVPTQLDLAPGEARKITMRLDPPAGARDGEYYARIVAVVNPPKPTDDKKRDAKKQFKMPILGQSVPPLRDSVRVFFRKGPQTLGLAVGPVTTGIGAQPEPATRQQDWVRLPVHLTGTATFDGLVRHFFRNDETGETTNATTFNITFYKDGVIDHWCDVPSRQLQPGKYTLVIIFEPTQTEFAEAQRLPMKPLEVNVPVVIK